MKTYNEIADRVLNRRDAYAKKIAARKKTAMRVVPVAAAFCLVLLTVLAVRLALPEHPDQPQPTVTDNEGRTLWVDTRIGNGAKVLTPDSYIEWPWEYRTTLERYRSVKFGGIEYTTRSAEISASLLGEKLGKATATGYDPYTELPRTTVCEVYGINGIASEHLIAVRFSETEGYYVFLAEEYVHFETLGAFMDAYALDETLPLTRFSDHTTLGVSSPNYVLSDEDSDTLWEMLIGCKSAPYVGNYGMIGNEEKIVFTVKSETLGITNKVFSISTDGYVKTNLAEYGFAFEIGEDAAAEIIRFVKGRWSILTEEIPSRFYLAGTVTEIGDGYIKVDDSILMQDPDDGIIFTVKTDDIRVRRHIERGHVRVGDTVQIEYDGKIYTDAPTVIENAFGLSEAVITTSGEVLIPE